MKTQLKRKYKINSMGSGKLAVLGGDSREMMVAQALLARGWQVGVYGRPASLLPPGARLWDTAEQALSGAKAVILPAPPLRDGGRIYNAEGLQLTVEPEDFASLAPGTPVLAGVLSPFLRQVAAEYKLQLVETLEAEEIALPFALATAEGAIAIALNATGEVLAHSKALIIGYGRIGRALAPRLRGLQMQVLVANRGHERLSLAAAEGYHTIGWPAWPKAAGECAFIFNTAPHLLLDAQVLPQLPAQTVIIDLAAAPGGTDFALAEQLGLQAILAGGLPGKHAPSFAGGVMARFYPRLLQAALARQGLEGGK